MLSGLSFPATACEENVKLQVITNP